MRFTVLIVFIFGLHSVLFSQGTIRGKVIDKTSKEALPSADIHLVELKRGTITKFDGSFVIFNVPGGEYTLEISYVGYKKFREKVKVNDGETVEIEINLEQTVISLPGVVITGTMYEKSAFEIYQPIAVLDEDKLGLRLSDNIAKTLSYQPGINYEYNGLAVGRPVIRGLSGTRVLILENGVRIADASDLTHDHAVSFEPTSLERVEVLRGPASLFYGVNSIGGAINIITEDIPRTVHDKLRGSVRLYGSTVNSSLAGTGSFDYGIGNFAFRGEFGYRDAKNLKIPDKTLENTNFKNFTSSVGLAYHSKALSTGFAFRNFKGEYGIPHLHHHEEEGEQHHHHHNPRFKIARDKYAFKTDLKLDNPKIHGFELFANYINYDHRELEEGDVITHIRIKTSNVDLKAKHHKIGHFSGMLGLNFMHQNYGTVGEEKFFADADLYLASLILYEELELSRVNLQAGLRYDFALVNSEEFRNVSAQRKKYNVLSSSFGVVYKFAEPTIFSLNYSRGFRVPALQELFAYGPHLGTMSFEIGNPNLKVEVSNEIDLSVRFLTQRTNAEISGFLNYIDNYIYAKATGRTDSETRLPIYEYASANAVLRGFELKFEHELLKNLNTTLLIDYVEGKNRTTGDYLPMIPPLRTIFGVEYRTNKYNLGFEIKAVSDQDKVAPRESRTPGYAIVNLHLGLRLPFSGFAHEVNLNIENLTNRKYYDHLSRIKGLAMPGRNIVLVYHLLF